MFTKVYRTFNFCVTPDHTYGCCKSYYRCPCVSLGAMPDSFHHYTGCRDGSCPCECWKLIENDNGAALITDDPYELYTVIMRRLRLAYEPHIVNYRIRLPKQYEGTAYKLTTDSDLAGLYRIMHNKYI